MRGRTERLGDALARALPGLDLAQRRREGLAMAAWPELVGATTAARTRAVHVNRGVMVVKVASAAWANQLNLLKAQLLERLSQRVGPGVVADLRWRVGTLDGPEALVAPAGSPRRGAGALPSVPLPPEAEARIAAEVAQIKDAGLAERVRRALVRQASRQAALRAQGWTSCDRCGALHDVAADRQALCPPCRREGA